MILDVRDIQLHLDKDRARLIFLSNLICLLMIIWVWYSHNSGRDEKGLGMLAGYLAAFSIYSFFGVMALVYYDYNKAISRIWLICGIIYILAIVTTIISFVLTTDKQTATISVICGIIALILYFISFFLFNNKRKFLRLIKISVIASIITAFVPLYLFLMLILGFFYSIFI
ncbi:MAG: hypothetical protein WBP45_01745 [Daejeonella sp.]